MVWPAIVAGPVLCCARALGEFGATITFAGNFPGVTQTMPLAVYTALESDRGVAIALSIVLLAVSVTVLVALRGRYLRSGASA
jgi:molybdate transport system permease protein